MMTIPRVCITCGRPSVPGRSRCRDHGGKVWAGKPPARQAAYRNPEYLANRKLAIEREPTCHWGLPGCRGKSTTADHLKAVSAGGGNGLDNLVGSCWPCNLRRGASLGGQVSKLRRKQQRG